MKRKAPLRRTGFKRKKPVEKILQDPKFQKINQRNHTINSIKAKQAFREAGRLQRRCQHPDCPKPTNEDWDSHHVVYRQHIAAQKPGFEYDVRAALRLCDPCHGRQHNRKAPVPLTALLDCNIEFAAEVFGPEQAYGYLTRRYSGEDPRIEALLT